MVEGRIVEVNPKKGGGCIFLAFTIMSPLAGLSAVGG